MKNAACLIGQTRLFTKNHTAFKIAQAHPFLNQFWITTQYAETWVALDVILAVSRPLLENLV